MKKRQKYICFVDNCTKAYLYICTLKKHLIFSHKTEYDVIMADTKKINFFAVFKDLKKNEKKLEFINFKNSENCDFNENGQSEEQEDEDDENSISNYEEEIEVGNCKRIFNVTNENLQKNENLKPQISKTHQTSCQTNESVNNSNNNKFIMMEFMKRIFQSSYLTNMNLGINQLSPFNFNSFQQNYFNINNICNFNLDLNFLSFMTSNINSIFFI